MRRLAIILVLFSSSPLYANCWERAGQMYNVPPLLLYAMAQQESSLNPTAFARANNGTYSVGLMQINSSWFPQLEKYGITERDLYHPCTSIHVGAWILAQEIERYGLTWTAVGAYYAGAYTEETKAWKLRHYRDYASKVMTRLSNLEQTLAQGSGN